MADEPNIFGEDPKIYGNEEKPKKRFRNTLDDDVDRLPGGPSASKEYSLKYDRRSESEYTNQLETQNQIEERNLLIKMARQDKEARDALRHARNSVHFFPSVGKFIIPPENTWAAHMDIVKSGECDLCFNTDKFVFFDKIVAEKFGNPALYDPNHPDYTKFEGLRNNIAVMRNDIIGLYLDDGSFDPGDEKYVPYFTGIAAALGEALSGDKWFKRPFVNSINVGVANVEGVGAAEMYKYLLEIQEPQGGALHGVRDAIGALLQIPDRAWGLPSLEYTPFSPEGLSAPPPHAKTVAGLAETAAARSTSTDEPQRMVDASHGITRTAASLSTPESLDDPTREASVDEARKILRWLRNLQFGDRDMEAWLDQGTPAEQAAKAEAVARLTEIYGAQLKGAAPNNAELLKDPVIEDASTAAGALAFGLSMHSLNALPDGHPGIEHLETLMESMPPHWEMRQAQPLSRLLDFMEEGIAKASGLELGETTPTDRLIREGQRLTRHARDMRSVESMQPPAREESIELAREILRKLKNLGFSDKTLQEIVDTGRPEDKARLAETAGDAVEAYRNLLAEAAHANPALAQDKHVQEAGEAAGQFAHAIALMAAKEMPNSIAAAQQISADATQNPEEWKNLHGHTVDRLVKSMEGGLEKAVGEIAAQQEQQEQAEEVQAAAELAAQHSGQSRRRRRRRSSRSGMGGAKQRKQHTDITADDYALRQGRFREEQKMEGRAAFAGLDAEALAAVRALGGKLNDIGKQTGNLAAAATAPSGPKVAVNDKKFSARTDRDSRDKKNVGPMDF